MNAIHLLSTQPWVERLGSTLLHFLWQGILIAAVYAAARRWFAGAARPNVRYVLACAALAVMAAAPLLTWSLLRPATTELVSAPAAASNSAAHTSVGNVPAIFVAGGHRAAPASFLFWVVTAWLAGALIFWLRLLGGWILAERLRSTLARPAPDEWQQALNRLKARIHVSRPVGLLVSALVQAPAVVGWLRPAILVPVGALTGLPAGQIEALLLHELAHIRRHDYLVNALQSVVEALLFYHPAVWWISGHMRAERELCCDDMAVSITGDAATYARALAELESARLIHLRAVMAASGGFLAHRIARLVGQSRPAARTVSGPGIVAAVMLPAITAFAVLGQPIARPKFDVASIKPSLGQGLRRVRPLPGRLTADAPVRLLIQNAYAVQAFEIEGGPAWTDSERYELEAKAGGNASRAQLFLMLQSLLEDRFQLRIHRETRELPVYALVAAKSGLKLSSPKEGGCVEPGPEAPPDWAGGRMAVPGSGPLPPARCGVVSVMLQMVGARMQGGGVGMPELVRALSLILERTVVDKTGYTGLFDVGVDFQQDETTPAMPPPPPDSAPAEPRSPSIATAIQQQLGLRLESGKGPVEVIVIDHIERPSAN